MALTWTYDPTIPNPVYTIRRWLGDTDFSSVGLTVPMAERTALFADQEIQAYIADVNGDLFYAWALMLEAVAGNNALLAIAVNLGGGSGSVDFTQRAAQLRASSQSIRDFANSIPAGATAETANGPIADGRIWANEWMREFNQ